MENEIIKVLDELGKRFGIAIDWTAENVMPYLQELGTRFIMYRNCMAILWSFVSLIMIIAGILLVKKMVKYVKSDKYDEYDDVPWIIFFGCIAAFLLIGGSIVLFCNINGIIQNICMPEITIVEYIKSLTTNY